MTTNNKPKAYCFWYISCRGGRTQYVYVIAFTQKQASYLYYQYINGTYDYSLTPCHSYFINRYLEVGTVLGDEAIYDYIQ